MHELAPLIRDLAVMLCVASFVTLLFQKIRQPIVLGYLIAGIIVGPYTPPHALVADIPNIKILSELGVIFLMFSLGLEFSFHKLTRVGFSSGITGLLEVVLMSILGFATGKLIGWSFHDSLFLGAALAISSTTIIIKAIDELGLLKKRFAEIIFGVLVVEDLLAILLLVALSTVVLTKNIFSVEMVWAAGKLILVVGSWFILGYFLIPTLLRKIMQYASEETITIVSVGLCLFLVSVAAHFHYSTALGAFIMGSILAETPLVHRIERLIKPIRDIFASVFFISVGMLVDPYIIMKHGSVILLLTVVTIFGKLLITGTGAFLTGQSLNNALRIGFGMAQIGEFSFIIIGLGVTLSAISDSLYPIIVAVSAITTFTTPYLIKFSGYLAEQLDTHLPYRMKSILENYSQAIYKFFSKPKKQSVIKKALIRLMINGLVVAVIFTLIDKFVYPLINAKILWAQIICWVMTMILSAPFIWGMVFSFTSFESDKKQKRFHPVLCLSGFITSVELIILSSIYFHENLMLISLIVTFGIVFIIFYRFLEKTYHWFEKRLIENVKTTDALLARYEALAPWDKHLMEVSVSEQTIFAGKELQEIDLRDKFGVNVVAIYRGTKNIPAPGREEKIMPGDKLVVLGNEEQIDIFVKSISIAKPQIESKDQLENFELDTLVLRENNPLIGKTIRESNIREIIQGLIVGLERNGKRILNPDSNLVLEKNDLLFMVGSKENLNEFKTTIQD